MGPVPEPLGIAEFRVVREYLCGTCGLWFADDKCARVAEAVGSRMSTLGVRSFSQYHHMLTASPGGSDELASLAALVTVGETHFFRNKDQWLALEQCVLPWILEEKARAGRQRLRICSAGCSTGEEAYTVSIVLRECLTELAQWSIEIIGTDISPVAIAAARRAIYTENSFREVPQGIRERYFEPVDAGRCRPRADIRQMVRFQELNLLDARAVAEMRDVDIILCRNVLIYFDGPAVEAVLAHFHQSLAGGGYLFLGHAESVHGIAAGFASLNVCDTFVYKPIPRDSHHVKPVGVRQSPERAPTASVMPRASTEARCPAQPAAVPEAPPLDDLRARAIGCLCAGENAAAGRTFEEILGREPNDVQSLLGTALLLAGSGSSEAALEYCKRVLEVHPMSAEAYCVMALVHEGLGEDGAARRELEKAVYLDDGFAVAHFRLACLNDRMGRPNAVTREIGNALRALADDDEQRVRMYSGGFNKGAIERLCEQRLGNALPTTSSPQRTERVPA